MNQPRIQPGQPTGGRFAEKPHAEADVSLDDDTDVAASGSYAQRMAELRARKAALMAQKGEIDRQLGAVAREITATAEAEVRSWKTPTPEQMLSLAGTRAVSRLVKDICQANSRGHHIQPDGLTSRIEDDRWHPHQFAISAVVRPGTDLVDMGEAISDIADHLRVGDGEVHADVMPYSGENLDAALENGKARLTLVVADAGHATATYGYRSEEPQVIATGTPGEALAEAVRKSYSGELP